MSQLARFTLPRTEITGSAEEIGAASERFAREHAVRLPGLLAPDFLAFVQKHIEADGFHTRVHDALPSRPTDLVLNPSLAPAALLLAVNEAHFLGFARQVTRRREIASFRGHITRRVPGAGHGDVFHDDLIDGRIAVLTINLGSEPYEGGALQIREGSDGPIVFEQINNGPGDAILFKIEKGLKHRVTPPEGHVARTVFAGWFHAEPASAMFDMPAENIDDGEGGR